MPPGTTAMSQKQTTWAVVSLALLVSAALGLYLSFRYLPSIAEMPPGMGSGQEEQNWLGQGLGTVACYVIALLLVTYCLKRVILMRCKRRWTAACFFSLLVVLSLPYIWFLCEPDWFNTFIYRISCWVGGPIAFWCVPAVSFLIDLFNLETPKSLKHYLIRSAVEVVVIFPIWVVFWAFFSFYGLGWGWI